MSLLKTILAGLRQAKGRDSPGTRGASSRFPKRIRQLVRQMGFPACDLDEVENSALLELPAEMDGYSLFVKERPTGEILIMLQTRSHWQDVAPAAIHRRVFCLKQAVKHCSLRVSTAADGDTCCIAETLLENLDALSAEKLELVLEDMAVCILGIDTLGHVAD